MCNFYAAVRREPHATFAEPANSHRVDLVFLLEHAFGETLLGVAGEDRHRRLDDDRSAVHFRRHEVDRAAMDARARGEHAPVRAKTVKRRQERRMDVHEAPGEAADEAVPEDSHETGEHDEIGGVPLDLVAQCASEGGAVGVSAMSDDMSGDPVRVRGGESCDAGHVADHCGDIGGELGPEQRRHVAAAAGNEDDEALQAYATVVCASSPTRASITPMR